MPEDEHIKSTGPSLDDSARHRGWTVLPPAHIPRPTYFPAGLAMGTTFLFWGFITSWVVCAVGVALFAAALAGWITEIRYERKHHP
jgi:hypothetical protein